MSRAKPARQITVPRKLAVRRSLPEHRNRYADLSPQPHDAYGRLLISWDLDRCVNRDRQVEQK